MKVSALIFDLDGTLVDSVYQHVLAWQSALLDSDFSVPACEIHKRVGMTGALLIDALADAFSLRIDDLSRSKIAEDHGNRYRNMIASIRPLPGATAIWTILDQRKIRWAIATSSEREDAQPLLQQLHLPEHAVVVTQGGSGASKPSPELFETAAKKLGAHLDEAIIVGDAVWDILASRRAGAFGVGVLTGGYGREELVAAGAYRVYADIEELGRRLDELGLH